jgi:hypothetical protein
VFSPYDPKYHYERRTQFGSWNIAKCYSNPQGAYMYCLVVTQQQIRFKRWEIILWR